MQSMSHDAPINVEIDNSIGHAQDAVGCGDKV